MRFTTKTPHGDWSEVLTFHDQSVNEARIPIDGTKNMQEIEIEVPKATSPRLLFLSSDTRVLGLNLQSMDVQVVANSSRAQDLKFRF